MNSLSILLIWLLISFIFNGIRFSKADNQNRSLRRDLISSQGLLQASDPKLLGKFSGIHSNQF